MRDEYEQRRFGLEPEAHDEARRWEGHAGQHDLDEPGPRGEYEDFADYGGRGYGGRRFGESSAYEGRGYGSDYDIEGRGGYENRGGYDQEPGFGRGQGYSNIFDEERRSQRMRPGYTSPREGVQQQDGFRGTGPKGYSRTDAAILEDVCDELQDADIDASEVSVEVENGYVTLTGRIDSRWAKRFAEDISYSARGVRDVRNQLEVDTSGVQERRATAQRGNGQRRRGTSTLTGGAQPRIQQ